MANDGVLVTPSKALASDGFVDSEGDAVLAALLKDLPKPVDAVAEEFLARPPLPKLPKADSQDDESDDPVPDELKKKLAEANGEETEIEPEPENKPDENSENSRGMLRLIEKDTELTAREKAFEEKERGAAESRVKLEKRLAEVEALLDSTKKTAVDYTALRRKLLTEPVKFLEEELKLPPDQVTRIIIAQKLGDAAPPELVRLAKDKQIEIELQDIRDELARERRELKVERSRGTVDEHLTKGESKYPTLSAVAKLDRARVSAAVFAKVRAVVEAGTELDEAVVERAAKEVEEDWSLFSKVFSTATAQDLSKQGEAATKNEPNGGTIETKKRVPPPAKLPARKTPYWVKSDAEDAAYVDEVMRDVMTQVKNK